MKKESDELKTIVMRVFAEYKNVDDAKASIILAEDKWSVKEIFGHLIDSASNNQQRFVRLQEQKKIDFPTYHYTWVKVEKYNEYDFQSILELWKQFNLFIAHIIENIETVSLTHEWQVNGQSFSLEFLVKDYIRHLEEHLGHLNTRHQEICSWQKEKEGVVKF